MATAWVLLHGFTQTARAWDPVCAALGERVAHVPDLRGHGTAAHRRPIDTAALVGDVLDGAPERFALAGYSMGGRLALHVALAAPGRVSALALLSATAGIDDPAQAAERRRADAALAAAIENDGVAAFARRWADLALFEGQAPAVREAAQRQRLGQDAAGLAASLRGFGTGTMAPVWARLGELDMPAAVIVGERDTRYRALGERLAGGLGRARTHVVAGAGHAVALEAPGAVAGLLARL